MGTSGIEQLLYMMDVAFDGDVGEGLMGNLRSVPPEYWSWLPPGGRRTVREIVSHVGVCKFVYGNHAFGDQSMRWEDPATMPSIGAGASPEEVMAWLREGQMSLREQVAGLADDGELLVERFGWSLSYGMETRKVIGIMLLHDAYHAGEINHIRALGQQND